MRRSAAFRAAAQPAGPCDDADPAWHLLDRESGAGGTGSGARLRIRLHRTAAEDQGRHRVGGGTDRHSLRADRLVAAPLHTIERTPIVAVVDARRYRDVI